MYDDSGIRVHNGTCRKGQHFSVRNTLLQIIFLLQGYRRTVSSQSTLLPSQTGFIQDMHEWFLLRLMAVR